MADTDTPHPVDADDVGASSRTARRVVELLLRDGPMTRADIARTSGVGRSTVSEAVAELTASGVVVEAPATPVTTPRGRGRPGTLLTLNPATGTALGVDFGWSHVRAVAVDAAHTVLVAAEREMPAEYAPAAGLDVSADLLDEVAAKARRVSPRVIGVGASVPGPLELEGQAPTQARLPGWEGLRVADELQARRGWRVVVDNDTNLAAAAEARWGAGRGARDFLFFKLHSGVGGAVVLDGHVLHGHTGGAGEFGHMALDPAGPLCRCGNKGCLETYAGIPALVRTLEPSLGPLTLAEVRAKFAAGDPACRRAVMDAAHRVGQAAGILCNALAPQRLVIGGALASIGAPLLEEIERALRLSCLPVNAPREVVAAQLDRMASARGAASLVLAQSWLD